MAGFASALLLAPGGGAEPRYPVGYTMQVWSELFFFFFFFKKNFIPPYNPVIWRAGVYLIAGIITPRIMVPILRTDAIEK
jgi:hypothetical protein